MRGFCSWCPSKFFLSKNLFFANPVQNVSMLRLPSETSGFCRAHTSTLTSLFAIFLKIWIVIWDGRNTKLSGPENKQEIHQASTELSLGPPTPMPSRGVSPPSALGHAWDIRRDPRALCLLCIPIIPYVCMARKHFALTYFALMFGTWTRCYALTGLCAAKKENS